MSEATRESWQSVVAPYVGADILKSVFQLVSTLALLIAVLVATYWISERSLLLAGLALPLASGLLVRTFIIMHDCAHGSFLPSVRANNIIGRFTGLLAFTPFDQWRRDHAIHHASSGDLDRRGHGDVTTWTVREYLAKTPKQQLGYRLSRHPLLLVLGGPFYLVYTLRFRPRSKATGKRQLWSIWWTNIAIVGLFAFLFAMGGVRAMTIYALAYYGAAVTGVWLFYVQHQFEDAYWESHEEWDYETSAIKGSSHLRLPKILQWFTGSIGLHHVHHLAPKIPNYRLQKAHDDNPRLQTAPVITIPSGIAALRLSLWDEDRRRLIGFSDLKRQHLA
ncbi:MAG TPA: fatty acid desaturase [Gemmatimonadaceae bacterium]|nr:fatty acid desaturase [Gemmatimonadaceae bacterium]